MNGPSPSTAVRQRPTSYKQPSVKFDMEDHPFPSAIRNDGTGETIRENKGSVCPALKCEAEQKPALQLLISQDDCPGFMFVRNFAPR